MSWPVDQPPHRSWRDKRRDWTWPRTSATPRAVPPDYTITPQNVTRMYAGALARDLELDRMYHEAVTPPTTPQPPNLVWPAPGG